MSLRLFNLIALVVGLVYVFATPPFMVPDESGHMWRSFAFSQGYLMPAKTPVPLSISVEDRMGVLFWHVDQTVLRTGKYGLDDLKLVWQLVPDGVRQNAQVAWIYTPAPYLAQTASVWVTTRLNLRPLVVFYAGRVANLIGALLMISVAMRVAPQCRMIFALITLLPMTMYELASWSGDAATIGFAFMFVAFAVRAASSGRQITRGDIAAMGALVLLIGLCKPAYFLLAGLVIAIPAGNFRSTRQRLGTFALIGILGALATLASMTYFNRGFFNMRPLLPVNPDSQMDCIRNDPPRFAGVVMSEVLRNGRFYVEGLIGRFGMYDVKLPLAVVFAGVIAMLAVALTSHVAVSAPWRMLALAIFLATAFGLIVSQYLIWSVVCGDYVEGVQGRYFLPVLPLLMIVMSGAIRRQLHPVAVCAVLVACNAAAVITLITHYWI